MPGSRRPQSVHSTELHTFARRWQAAADLARRQHGIVTRAQLRGVRLTDHQVTWAIRTARLRPVHRGVLAVGPGRLTQAGRWSAAVLACGTGAALGYRAAAAHWDLRPTSARTIEVVVARSSRPTHRDVTVHRHPGLVADEVVVRDGIAVTTVARTVLDLAAVLSTADLRRTVAQADLLGRFDRREVDAFIARHPRHRGRLPLRRVLDAWSDDPATTRSPQEDAFPALCARFGFPRPVMNAEVLGMEVDAVFFDQRVAVELDGYAFHAGAIQWENDHEKRARLVGAGWTVLAYSWRQQRDDGGRFVRDTLGSALRRGGWSPV